MHQHKNAACWKEQPLARKTSAFSFATTDHFQTAKGIWQQRGGWGKNPHNIRKRSNGQVPDHQNAKAFGNGPVLTGL